MLRKLISPALFMCLYITVVLAQKDNSSSAAYSIKGQGEVEIDGYNGMRND